MIKTYHHDNEDEGWNEVCDGVDADSGADGQTQRRAAHRRQKQRQERLEELGHVQLQSFTAAHTQQIALCTGWQWRNFVPHPCQSIFTEDRSAIAENFLTSVH